MSVPGVREELGGAADEARERRWLGPRREDRAVREREARGGLVRHHVHVHLRVLVRLDRRSPPEEILDRQDRAVRPRGEDQSEAGIHDGAIDVARVAHEREQVLVGRQEGAVVVGEVAAGEVLRERLAARLHLARGEHHLLHVRARRHELCLHGHARGTATVVPASKPTGVGNAAASGRTTTERSSRRGSSRRGQRRRRVSPRSPGGARGAGCRRASLQRPARRRGERPDASVREYGVSFVVLPVRPAHCRHDSGTFLARNGGCRHRRSCSGAMTASHRSPSFVYSRSPLGGALSEVAPTRTDALPGDRLESASGAASLGRAVRSRSEFAALRPLKSRVLDAAERIADLVHREMGKPEAEALERRGARDRRRRRLLVRRDRRAHGRSDHRSRSAVLPEQARHALARGARRRRRHRAVELPLRAPPPDDRAGAPRRERRAPQAERGFAAHGGADRRDARRARARLVCSRSFKGGGEVGTALVRGRRRSRLFHGERRHRAEGRARVRGASRPMLARARREGRRDRPRRREPRARRERRRLGSARERGAELRGDRARVRRARRSPKRSPRR